jgi:general secretion pathway protein M
MMTHDALTRFFGQRPGTSLLLYLGAVFALLITFGLSLSGVIGAYREREDARDRLNRIEARLQRGQGSSANNPADASVASPFLEAPSATMASAELIQVVTKTITDAGGTLTSSEVEPRSAQSKTTNVAASASFEMETASLQQVLYTIEAATPYLFIDRLSVQAPPAPGEGRVRVQLGVSGFWAEKK